MKPNLTIYRGRIAKIRYYLAQLSGGAQGGASDWAKLAMEEICELQQGRQDEHLEINADTARALIVHIIEKHVPRNPDVLKYCALITYELNRLPYAPPQPKQGFIARLTKLLKY